MTKKLNRQFPITAPVTTSASDTLRETLEYYHITQQDFAHRLGISQAHVSDILNRRKFMSDELALKIEQVTGIKAEFLLRRDFQYQLELLNDKRSHIAPLERYDWTVV